MERPGSLGRYVLVLFGAVTASAGVAEWATVGSALGLALGAFGSVLLVLGIVQHHLYRRDQAYWPDQAHLWADGVELVLHNGEVRGATWSDPDLALHMISRRAPPPIEREYLLVWLADSKVPPVELSAQGFDQLRQAAAHHDLEVSQSQRGRRADGVLLIEIRQGAAVLSAALAKPTGTSGSD